jgi:CHAT domain-containing protein
MARIFPLVISFLFLTLFIQAKNPISELEFKNYQDSLDYYQFSYQVGKNWRLCGQIESAYQLTDKQKTIIKFYKAVNIIDLGDNSDGYILIDECLDEFSGMQDTFWYDRTMLFYNRVGYFNAINFNGRDLDINQLESDIKSFEKKYPAFSAIVHASQLRLYHFYIGTNLPQKASLEIRLTTNKFNYGFFKAQLLGLQAEDKHRNENGLSVHEYMIQALEMFETLNLQSSLSYAYLYRIIGIKLKNNNDLELARLCHIQQFTIAQENQIKDFKNNSYVNGYIAFIWIDVLRNNYDKVWSNLQNIRQKAGHAKRYDFLKFGKDHLMNDFISKLYLSSGKIDESIVLSLLTINDLKELSHETSTLFSDDFLLTRNARYHTTLAEAYLQKGEPTEAIQLLEPFMDLFFNKQHLSLTRRSELQNCLASAYLDMQDYRNAARIFEIALNNYLGTPNAKRDPTYFKSVQGLVECYFYLNNEKRFKALINSSLKEIILYLGTRQVLRAKSNFLAQVNDYLQTIVSLISLKSNKNYKELSEVVEFQKSIINYHYLEQKQNKVASSEIIELEQKVFKMNYKGPAASFNLLDSLEKELIILNLKTISSFNEIQPKIHFLETSPKNYQDDELFINYFISNDSLGALVHHDNAIDLYKLIPIEEFNNHTQSLLSSIYDYYHNCHKSRDSLNIYESIYNISARYLYKAIMKPIIRNQDIKTIKISPVGNLHLLPLETLIQDNGKYLIESYAIHYDPISSYNPEPQDNSKKDNFYYAPIFNEVSDTFCVSDVYRTNYLGPLKYNTKEVNDISEVIEGEVFQEDASKDSFLKQSQNANLIHLATHGKIDVYNDNLSFLAFSNSQEDLSQRLYLREIEFSDFNINCLVLSSCESGLGKIYTGEGVRSLASRFLSSGVRSVISTLWSVNDRSTSMLMANFYNQLKKGKRKDQALRQAKLEYLSSVDEEYRHPFYWSGIIALGDMSPLPLSSRFNFLTSLLILIPLCFMIYWKVK